MIKQEKAVFYKMLYRWKYETPDQFSDMFMCSDGEHLTGLWFEGSRDTSKRQMECVEKMLPVFQQTCDWLDLYFSGKNPDFMPEYKIRNITPFRQDVLDIMNNIPFGETLTYGEIAAKIAEERGIKQMSAQAVGGAVGWNPICIIIPCHRVVGSNGSLTGYSGGIANKVSLLTLEGVDMKQYYVPKKGTAL